MIIISQDKTKIFNFEQIRKIDCGNGMIVVDSTSLLGEYSTEEKAIKVLDMIQNKYFEHMTVESNGAIVGVLERPKVFQMPQDSEV